MLNGDGIENGETTTTTTTKTKTKQKKKQKEKKKKETAATTIGLIKKKKIHFTFCLQMCSKLIKTCYFFWCYISGRRLLYMSNPLTPKSARKILITSLARFLGSSHYLIISAIHLSISQEYRCRTPHVLAFQPSNGSPKESTMQFKI